jgi:glucose-6-phosphate-specific signal transduction histidine kinase
LIRDDGAGGADAARGSGLIGLRDRVEAVGGTMTPDSPAVVGTALTVLLPVTVEDDTRTDSGKSVPQMRAGREVLA